ncbi:Uncharacterised protein [Cedecea neteri]|uniref:Uncharacterized protein n=1 Tax=Cedecea neteri TaxID=158822 RepID=A0A2X3KTD2_9ENTR|nr:Uncharacterised protein [Cedecea neteri]
MLGAFLADSNPDLSTAAAQSPIASLTNLLPFWFYVPFSIVIIVSLLAAAITGVYSSGLALLALGIPASRATTTTLNAAIIGFGAFYLMFISDSFLATFQSFLASISVVIGSAGAIQLIDFLRQKRLGWDVLMANKAGFGGRDGRWTALLSLGIATIVGAGHHYFRRSLHRARGWLPADGRNPPQRLRDGEPGRYRLDADRGRIVFAADLRPED